MSIPLPVRPIFLRPMDSRERAEESRVSDLAEEQRFWMDCCIAALSGAPLDADMAADLMLKEFRNRWRKGGVGPCTSRR